MTIESSVVREKVTGYFDDYIHDLEYITNIDSGTGNLEGSKKIAQFIKERLENFGGTVEFFDNDQARHVIARFQGTSRVNILMIAHTDTVFEKGEAQKRPFSVKDNKAYGPGVGDDKATVIQTIYVMKLLHEMAYHQYGKITLCFNGQEETGSEDADKMIRQLAKEADVCFIMDTARPNWGIVTQRKGRSHYIVKVKGKTGHAGNSARQTASATVELANQILLFHQLANTDDQGKAASDITVNIGIIGTPNQKVNVIPDEAYAEVEIRAFKKEELQQIEERIRTFPGKTIISGTVVSIDGKIENVPLEETAETRKLVDLYRNVVSKEFGSSIREEHAGGLTDGNVTALYIPTIDGVGIENYGEHTDQEWVDLKTVIPRTVALALFIDQVAEKWQPTKSKNTKSKKLLT